MIDYVKWRGDITFEESPLNEIDSLIFTELSYLPLEDIVPSVTEGGSITIHNALDKFLNKFNEDVPLGAIIPGASIIALFKAAALSKRFSNVKMWAYENDVNTGSERQFSALCFLYGKRLNYVAYRGTDDTLIGWKEDFNMALYTPIPAQTAAVEYINKVSRMCSGTLTVGGHSKGGNLAVYSSLCADKRVRRRIVQIHNFDGPGFTYKFLDAVNDEVTVSKIMNYLPNNSYIGRIFDIIGEHKIVESKEKGLNQHDAFSWEVLGASFVEQTEFTQGSNEFHELLKVWVGKMSVNDRNRFVDSFYRIITSTNASTLSDIVEDKLKFIKGVLTSDDKDRKIVIDGIMSFLKEKSRIKSSIKSKNAANVNNKK